MKIDELLVKIVLITAGISILILLAFHLKPTGMAGAVPTSEGILNILNSAVKVQDFGSCNAICGKQLKVCTLAVSSRGNLLSCDSPSQTILTCMCATIE